MSNVRLKFFTEGDISNRDNIRFRRDSLKVQIVSIGDRQSFAYKPTKWLWLDSVHASVLGATISIIPRKNILAELREKNYNDITKSSFQCPWSLVQYDNNA